MSEQEVTSDVLVRMKHIRSAKLCSDGARGWFAKYELSWNDFLTTGLPASVLLATGDPLAERVVAEARAEQ
jgi:hypothetical protein